jgi:FkbH-like protein
VSTLRAVPALDRMRLTKEDLQRAEQYAAEQARQEAWQRAGGEHDPSSLKEFLRSLALRLSIRRATAADVPRVAQLTQKTNQFNLSTIRRTDAEVEALRQDPRWRVYVLEVSDRFGDYGLTGVAIIQGPGPDGDTFDLETLLMSCRVLGRGVETGFLVVMIEDILKAGAARLTSRFIATAKNAPAREFLPDHGFREMADGRVVLEPLSLAAFDVDHLKMDAVLDGEP